MHQFLSPLLVPEAQYNNGVYTLNGYVSSLVWDVPAVSVDFNFGPDTNYGQTASDSTSCGV